MVQIIGGIIAVILGYFVLKWLLSVGLKLISGVAIISIGVLFAPSMFIGVGVDRILLILKIREIGAYIQIVVAWSCLICVVVFQLLPEISAWSFDSLKYVLPALIFPAMLKAYKSRQSVEGYTLPLRYLEKRRNSFYAGMYGSFALQCVSIMLVPLFVYSGYPYLSYAWYAGLAYWLGGTLYQLYVLGYESDLKNALTLIHQKLNSEQTVLVSDELIEEFRLASPMIDLDDIQILTDGVAAKNIELGTLIEVEVVGKRWLMAMDFYEKSMSAVKMITSRTVKQSRDDVAKLVSDAFDLPDEQAKDFSERYLSFGEYYDFDDGQGFVSYSNVTRVRTCECCGITELVSTVIDGPWYCSETCIETEKACIEIKEKKWSDFVAESATTGFVLIEGGLAWDKNHKIVAAGGQGHGFAAEEANNKIDISLGRSAKIVGGDNAKNGADRLVNGDLIQTKYYGTAARSIGAAFDGQNGRFRYFDNSGRPMQIEVPKDQYAAAVKEMSKRIQDGKVPGVTDPSKAQDLVRAGHLTYQQAVNITKFGTFESLAYDAAEGAVVGAVAGGISFGITATLYYINSGDSKQAIKVAALNAGKTFGKTMAVYVTAQQLHRLGVVQVVVSKISIGSFSPAIKNTIQNGLGVNSVSAADKALRGTVVTAVALVAVTTGPDLVKMINGRISGAQFVRNLSVATSSVGGGAIGAIAGGAIGVSFGPVGIWAGKVIGGIIGSSIAGMTANSIAKTMMKEDSEVIMEIIQVQVAYLAKAFILSKNEVDSLTSNLGKFITQETLELIFQQKSNRRATANLFVKPLVVGVIKQRPVLTYSANDIIDVCEEMAA